MLLHLEQAMNLKMHGKSLMLMVTLFGHLRTVLLE
jgi:hypothetical protein